MLHYLGDLLGHLTTVASLVVCNSRNLWLWLPFVHLSVDSSQLYRKLLIACIKIEMTRAAAGSERRCRTKALSTQLAARWEAVKVVFRCSTRVSDLTRERTAMRSILLSINIDEQSGRKGANCSNLFFFICGCPVVPLILHRMIFFHCFNVHIICKRRFTTAPSVISRLAGKRWY